MNLGARTVLSAALDVAISVYPSLIANHLKTFLAQIYGGDAPSDWAALVRVFRRELERDLLFENYEGCPRLIVV
jgi:hypothetical protein